ncbi:hypothetical protein M0R45_036053 [Rubus argutus]|uniref:MHC class I antigen n=1 Tax=Rubus argutus TaxID=59490 RepID=A0AAW1VVY9_RUBAR
MGMGSFVSGGDVEIWAMSDVGRGRRGFEAAYGELVASTSTTCWQQRRQGVDGGLAASVRLTATWEFRLGFATSTTAACGLAGQSMVMAWIEEGAKGEHAEEVLVACGAIGVWWNCGREFEMEWVVKPWAEERMHGFSCRGRRRNYLHGRRRRAAARIQEGATAELE